MVEAAYVHPGCIQSLGKITRHMLLQKIFLKSFQVAFSVMEFALAGCLQMRGHNYWCVKVKKKIKIQKCLLNGLSVNDHTAIIYYQINVEMLPTNGVPVRCDNLYSNIVEATKNFR